MAFFAFPLQQWLWELATMLHHTYSTWSTLFIKKVLSALLSCFVVEYVSPSKSGGSANEWEITFRSAMISIDLITKYEDRKTQLLTYVLCYSILIVGDWLIQHNGTTIPKSMYSTKHEYYKDKDMQCSYNLSLWRGHVFFTPRGQP
jgi:hypothetical protein